MNAPHEFHGTSGDVTVPLSAVNRDRLVGARPRCANSTRKMRAGRTRAMYWSPATTFRPKAHANTVTNSRPVLFAAAIIGSTSREIRPNRSSRTPNVTAPKISQSVNSMLDMPPRETSRSTSATPVSTVSPVAIASQAALIDSTTTLPCPATKSATTWGWVNAASTPANSADPSSASDAGALRTESTTSSTRGSRFTGLIQNSWSKSASSVLVGTASRTSGPVIQPRTRKTTSAIAKAGTDRKSTRLNSSHANISYAVFCLKKKNHNYTI